MSVSFTATGSGRDQRLDVFRGLALLTIFINHVPGNVFENFTSRNFGFSDAAEAFVLMSGIAVGLAYSRGFRKGEILEACMRVWRRAGMLYTTHIVTTVLAVGIIATGMLYLGVIDIIKSVNFTRFLDQPLQALVGVPLLGHQLGYFNILPMYMVLLIVSPLYILVGLRSRAALIALAVAIWTVAGAFRFNLPNYPNPGGWFFNPISWQLIYAVGIAGGLAMVDGRKLVPFHKWLYWSCVAYLAFSCVWVMLRLGGLPGDRALPFFLATFDKTFLSLPRLSHALALAYVLTNSAWVVPLLRMPAFRPIELIGRNGLAVFATGSVLAIALQVVRFRLQPDLVLDALLLSAGILAQYGVARLASGSKGRSIAAGSKVSSPALAQVEMRELA